MASRSSLRPPRRFACVMALVLSGLMLGMDAAQAQTFDATNLHGPQDLAATWLLHSGDDPVYAQPGFDDSHWLPFDSTDLLKNVIKNEQPSIVWYRLHVKVDPNQTELALSEFYLSDAFEIYVNGQRLLANGRVAPFEPYTANASLIRRIPDRQLATGHLVIAARVHITKEQWSATGPGLYANNLTLGQEPVLREHIWLKVIGDHLLEWIAWFAGAGLGFVAIALFAAQRRQMEYLWIFLLAVSDVARMPLLCYELFHNVPAGWGLLTGALEIPMGLFYFLTFCAILQVRLSRWLRILMVVAAVGYAISVVAGIAGSVSIPYRIMATAPMTILNVGILPILLVVHWRRGNPEAGILLIPAILQSLVFYVEVTLILVTQIPELLNVGARLQQSLYYAHVGPIRLDWDSLTWILFLLSFAIIILLRSTRISRQQALLEGEVAAAQEVQQVILPAQAETMPGFVVESIYKPAQQVGGDFFQIIPNKTDSSLLIVAGDVTGKGLRAGMLVALLVGAIRSTAETSMEPLAMLQALNRRLLGRGDAQATCLALRVGSDGSVTLANAGHLAPYLNGEPIEMDGALPLGLAEDAEFSVTRFKLSAEDRLMLMSDGVAEARDSKGQLFGFERVQELLQTTQSATQVATAAEEFGQEDDISVILLTRAAALTPALT